MDELKIYRVLSATGRPEIDFDLQRFHDLNIIQSCNLKSDILIHLNNTNPDILLVSDSILGDEELIEIMINCHKTYPDTRIVYLAGKLDTRDTARVHQLGALVVEGIYDILLEKVTPNTIRDVILYPKTETSVSFLKNSLLSHRAEIENAAYNFEYEGFGEDIGKDYERNNLFLIWSSKPGTGKSFLSANVACSIAKYGQNHPKVALIDGDLQNLSIGNIMSIPPNPEKSIAVAMNTVTQILHGDFKTDEMMRIATKKIRNCFVRYKGLSNLDILEGSHLTPQEADSLQVTPEHYKYLISLISDYYDIIIVDLNSSIYHPSTYVLMDMCKEVYCITNLDFNNTQNMARYKDTLKSFGLESKLKYVLNQDITNDGNFGTDIEEIHFTADVIEEKKLLNFCARIPNVPSSIFYNRQFEGKPLVLYKKSYTEVPRLALMELADQFYPLNDGVLDTLRASIENRKLGLAERIRKFFSRKKEKESVDQELDEYLDSELGGMWEGNDFPGDDESAEETL